MYLACTKSLCRNFYVFFAKMVFYRCDVKKWFNQIGITMSKEEVKISFKFHNSGYNSLYFDLILQRCRWYHKFQCLIKTYP